MKGRGKMSEWPVEHSTALAECLERGLSRAQAAAIINEKFQTTYTRNAVVGRASRMELGDSPKPPREPKAANRSNGAMVQSINRKRNADKVERRAPMPAAVKLVCVEIVPRHLSVVDLEPGDCRYPYGGDAPGEPVTFCGHPRMEGRQYCVPHYHLCLGHGTVSERAASRGIAA